MGFGENTLLFAETTEQYSEFIFIYFRSRPHLTSGRGFIRRYTITILILPTQLKRTKLTGPFGKYLVSDAKVHSGASAKKQKGGGGRGEREGGGSGSGGYDLNAPSPCALFGADQILDCISRKSPPPSPPIIPPSPPAFLIFHLRSLPPPTDNTDFSFRIFSRLTLPLDSPLELSCFCLLSAARRTCQLTTARSSSCPSA